MVGGKIGFDQQDAWLVRTAPFLIGVVISTIFAVYAASTPMAERIYDWKLYDLFQGYLPEKQAASQIVLIDIDDQTLAATGQWPWPRYRIGAALQAILEGRPAIVLVDFLLSEKDRSSLNNIKEQYRREFGLDIGFQGVPEGFDDNDGYLAQVIDQSPVVLASVLTQNQNVSQTLCLKQPLASATAQTTLHLENHSGVICPLDEFTISSAATGIINSTIDRDGLIRRIPLLVQHKDNIYPSLALAGVATLAGDNIEFGENAHGNLLNVWGREIPIGRNGTALLNFRGKGRSYRTIPAVQLLNGQIDPASFVGKIVIIGASATALNDIVSTHLDPAFPGSEAHAVIIDNILNGDVLSIPEWSGWAEAFTIMLIGILIAVLVVFATPSRYFSATLVLIVLLVAGSLSLFSTTRIYLSPYLSLINLGVVFAAVTLSKYYASEKRLAMVMKAISRANQSIIESMAAVAEMRDPETGGHIVRTQNYVRVLARHLQGKKHFRKKISDEYIEYLAAAAPLHDIGKVGISDLILLKPDKLTAEEFGTMKTHTTVGGELVEQAARRVGASPYLKIASAIAMSHHEKWDGSGYPQGLKGDDIPLSARIMAVADVFDALSQKRVYKAAMSYEQTISIITGDSGTHFDPLVIEGFQEIIQEFIEIAEKTKD